MKKNYSLLFAVVLAINVYGQNPAETVIGTTTYDLQTNGTTYQRLVYHQNGSLSAAWTFSADAGGTYSERGTGYNFFNGTSWASIPAARVENVRTGFPAILKTSNSKEHIISHESNQLHISSRNGIGTGAWSNTTISGSATLWPRAVSNGYDSTIHLIALTKPVSSGGTIYNGMDGALLYYRSSNEGISWDIVNMPLPGLDSSAYLSLAGDAYSMDVKGDTVVVVLFKMGGDVRVAKSINRGTTWTTTIIMDFPVDKYNADGNILDINSDGSPDTVNSSDESGSLLIDNNGMIHLFFGKTKIIDADSTSGALGLSYFPGLGEIRYWNETMGADSSMVIASPLDEDNSGVVELISNATYNAKTNVSMPTSGYDASGNLYCVYAAAKENNNNGVYDYRHVYLLKSSDGGLSWTSPRDLTQGSGIECVFPAMAKFTNDSVRFIYQRDTEPGMAVNGVLHPIQTNEIVYTAIDPTCIMDVKVSKTDFTGAGTNDGTVTINIIGGNSPYTYNWSNGATSATITGLSASTFSYTVTDDSGCNYSGNISITGTNTIDLLLGKNSVYNGYRSIPLNQITPWSFNGLAKNAGIDSLTNIVLNVNINNGTFTSASNNFALLSPGDSVILNANDTFLPGSIAAYNVSLELTTSETEGDTLNNFYQAVLSVTDSVYAMDDGTASGSFTWGSGTFYNMGNVFRITTPDTATSVSVNFASSTTAGELVNFIIYRVTDSTVNPIAQQSHMLTSNDIGGWKSVAIPPTLLDSGRYLVSFMTNSDLVHFPKEANPRVPPSQTSYVQLNDTGSFYNMNFIPFIRLNLGTFSPTRLVLTEEFTNASSGPDATTNVGFDNLLLANQGKIVTLKYHTNFPGTDPMNSHNPSEVLARQNYYSIPGVPHAPLDGSVSLVGGGHPANYTQATIDQRANTSTPFSMNVSHSISGDNDSIYVSVVIRAYQAVSGSLQGHIAIIEKQIDYGTAPGTNGEKIFRNVMKKMLPSATGTTLPVSFSYGDSAVINLSWALANIYDLSKLAVVAFVQDDSTKNILQAGYSAPLFSGCYASSPAPWTDQASGFSGQRTVQNIVASGPNTAWASTGGVGTGTYYTRTTNGGSTWQEARVISDSTSASFGFSQILGLNDNVAWALFYKNTGGGAVYKTADGGANWTQQNASAYIGATSFPNIIHFFDANNGIIMGDPEGGYFEIYRTTNGGASWSRVSSANIPVPDTSGTEYGTVSSYSAMGDTIWIPTNKGRILKSVNKGQNWTVSAPIPGTLIDQLAFINSIEGILHAYDLSKFKTTDGGNTWTPLTVSSGTMYYKLTTTKGTNPYYVSYNPTIGTSYSANGTSWTTIDNAGHDAMGFYDKSTAWASFQNTAACDGMRKLSPSYFAACSLAVSITGNNVSCIGCSNGSASPSITGGSAPFAYMWSNGSTASTINNLPAGTYSLTVTDANSCSASASVTISQPVCNISVTIAKIDEDCSIGSNGSAFANVSGGTAPYSYSWSNAATTPGISGLSAGPYSVTVTDSLGCTADDSKDIITNGMPSISFIISDASSCGTNDGAVFTTVSGGNSPYSYSWSNGLGSANLIAVSGGTFILTVTDSSGCTASGQVTIGQPVPPSLSGTVSNETSCTAMDGAILLTVSGGTSPFTYNWSSGATTKNLIGVAGGSYTITVTDANACKAVMTFTISSPGGPTITITGSDLSCNGSNDGAATVFVSGATTPYNYLWSNGKTTSLISGLTSGNYSVTVTAQNGCTQNGSVFINQPSALTVSGNVTEVTTCGGNDGAVFSSVSGGSSPYSFLWSNGAVASGISSLVPGNYILTVTDNIACSKTISFVVSAPSAAAVSFSVINPSCFDICNGIATANVSGGASPYYFTWSTGSNNATVAGLCDGKYFVTVTESNGCQKSDSVSITEPQSLSLAVSSVNSICGQKTGTATVTVSGGTTPYSYQWTNGDISTLADSLESGIYIITLTDNKGCSDFASAIINDNGGPTITVNNISNVNCYGGNNGAISMSVAGGTTPYIYLWNTGSTVEDISNLVAGPYEISVTDASGCGSFSSVTVSQPTAIEIEFTVINANCGNINGNASASVSGGTPPYSFLWSNGISAANISSVASGNYQLTVTDNKGCTVNGTAAISDIGGATLIIDSVINAGCGSFGGVYLTVASGVGPFSYLWSDGSTIEDLTSVNAGNYSISVTGSNGCSASAAVTVGAQVPLGDPICLVSVDTLSGGNLIAWEKIQGSGIQAYKVYKETSQSGVYQLAGTVPYDSLSQFVDINSNPMIKSYRYKIATVDSCGIESVLSGQHKTMHLTVNLGLAGLINLIWDDYQGFTFTTYYIYRYTNATGWLALDSIPSTNHSYSDLPPGGITYDLRYIVEARHPDGCTSTVKVENHNSSRSNKTFPLAPPPPALSASASATDVTQGNCDGTATVNVTGGLSPYNYLWDDSASTAAATATGLCAGTYQCTVTDSQGDTVVVAVVVGVQIGINDYPHSSGLHVYPNPNRGEFVVRGNQIQSVVIYNMIGEMVFEKRSPGSKILVNLSKNGNGVYFIQVLNEGVLYTRKIVVE